jgi:hypothetical protein
MSVAPLSTRYAAANRVSLASSIFERMGRRNVAATEPLVVVGEPGEPRVRTVFLLGAGASVPAGIPHTRALVASLESRCPPALKDRLDAVLGHLRQWTEARNEVLDIELVYETFVRLADAESDPLLSRIPPADMPAAREDAERLKRFTEDTIRDQMYAREDSLGYLEPLRGLVQRDGHLNVFSTNYDTCIELLCERLRLRWEDGFSVRWDPRAFLRRGVEVRLRKLHGSVLWFQDEAGGQFRSLVGGSTGSDSAVKWFGGECRPLILYPARKAGYDAPYVDNLAAFRMSLGTRDALTVLVVIGYSFRDDAIRKVVFEAARRNRLLTVVLVDPEAESIYESRLRSADSRPDIATPLRDRVLPLGMGLDKEGRVTRHLVNEVIASAAKAHYDERRRIEGDARDEYGWAGVATTCLKAANLRAYWRNVARSGEYTVGWDFVPALEKMLCELRLVVAFGANVPAERALPQFMNSVRSRWIAELTVVVNGPNRFSMKLAGSQQRSTSADEVAKPLMQAAEQCEADRLCLSSAPSRQIALADLSAALAELAQVFTACSAGASGAETSAEGLRASVVSPDAMPIESDHSAIAAWATSALQRKYRRCFERLVGIARGMTRDAVSAA